MKLAAPEKEQEAQSEPTEPTHSKTAFLAYPFKVLVSPFKAFKEIKSNPDFKGIVIIAVIVMLATAGLYYVQSTKLFFAIDGTQTNFAASSDFQGGLITALVSNVLYFAFNWLILAGVLLLVLRGFGQKGGSWRVFFVLVGYAFSVLIIQSVASASLALTLPAIQFSDITKWPSTAEEIQTFNTKVNAGIQQYWGPTPAYQAIAYLSYPLLNLIDIWLVMLSVVAVQTFSGVSWKKAAVISVTAFVIRTALRLFIG